MKKTEKEKEHQHNKCDIREDRKMMKETHVRMVSFPTMKIVQVLVTVTMRRTCV